MKKLLYIFGVFALFLAGRLLFEALNRPAPASAAQAIQPLTISQEAYSFKQDSAGQLVSRRTLARRTDGSEAEVDVIRVGLSDRFEVTRRIERADGTAATLIDAIQGKLSGYVDRKRLDRRLERMTYPARDCIEGPERVVSREVLFGHEFLVLEGSDTRAMRRSWKSPALGCLMVQFIQSERQGDGWKRVTHVVLRGLHKGEPDPLLFSGDEKYKEMTPTETYLETARKRGIDPDACPKCKESVWELEKAYWSRQAPPALPQ